MLLQLSTLDECFIAIHASSFYRPAAKPEVDITTLSLASEAKVIH